MSTSAPPTPRRILRGERHRIETWISLVRFGLVGVSGVVVNLSTFWVLLEAGGLHHLLAATGAFGLAVTNTFWWNRRWTFRAGDGRARTQMARFALVSLTGFLVAAGLLELLARLGVPALLAQVLALAIAAPLNFLGAKHWSFAALPPEEVLP